MSCTDLVTKLCLMQERDLPTNLHEDEHCLLDNLQVEATRNAAKICELEASVDARDSDILVLNKVCHMLTNIYLTGRSSQYCIIFFHCPDFKHFILKTALVMLDLRVHQLVTSRGMVASFQLKFQ